MKEFVRTRDNEHQAPDEFRKVQARSTGGSSMRDLNFKCMKKQAEGVPDLDFEQKVNQ